MDSHHASPARGGQVHQVRQGTAVGLPARTRPNAAADALATAELLLVVLRHAQRRGIATLGQLLAHSRTARQLEYARLPH